MKRFTFYPQNWLFVELIDRLNRLFFGLWISIKWLNLCMKWVTDCRGSNKWSLTAAEMLLAWKHGNFCGWAQKKISQANRAEWTQYMNLPVDGCSDEKSLTAQNSKERKVTSFLKSESAATFRAQTGSKYSKRITLFFSQDPSNYNLTGLSLMSERWSSIFHVSSPYFGHRIELFFWNWFVTALHCDLPRELFLEKLMFFCCAMV